MKSFDLVLPRTVEEVIAALPEKDEYAERRKVKVLAGGQDLLTEMKEHLEEPHALVNLKTVAGLERLEETPSGGLAIGALVTVARLEEDPLVRARFPLLAEAARAVASPQIRNLGTVGGNLCQRPRCWYYRNESTVCLKKGGDECFAFDGMNRHNAILGGGPSYIVHPSDLAPALVALDAAVTAAGPQTARTMPLEDFYVLPAGGDVTKETVLAANEIVTKVEIPSRDGWRGTFLKVRERDAFDFALSAVAIALRTDGPEIAEARVVLGGVAPKPWRSRDAERALVGRRIDAEAARAAGEEALRLAEPLEHNAYKIPMTKGLIAKALERLAG